MKIPPIPEGYHSVTPHLIVDDAQNAIEFYKQAFDATECIRHTKPDGKIAHAELQMGDSKIMLADESEYMNAYSPKKYNGSPISMHLYVKDVDVVFNKALEMGAKRLHPVENRFYGDRSGTIIDPFGHLWTISTHIEELTHEEIAKRAAEFYDQKKS
jgi:PhnB protein